MAHPTLGPDYTPDGYRILSPAETLKGFASVLLMLAILAGIVLIGGAVLLWAWRAVFA